MPYNNGLQPAEPRPSHRLLTQSLRRFLQGLSVPAKPFSLVRGLSRRYTDQIKNEKLRDSNKMLKQVNLTAYWFTFPTQPHGPLGIGVTAYSQEDAMSLMETHGYRFHINGESKMIEVKSTSQLDQSNVVRNMGPIVFRGIWYPNLNIGVGASGQHG